MVPEDINSFVYGFDLTSANYSGGAAGTFTNRVPGQQDWKVRTATPSFETRAGVEGMLFPNSVDYTLQGEHRALYECTIMMICEPSTSATMYACGGDYPSANSWGLGFNGNRAQAFSAIGTSGYTAHIAGQPNVFTISYSPQDYSILVQVNDGTVQSTTYSPDAAIGIPYPYGLIGEMRNLPFNGWIATYYVFSRAMFLRDNANLQQLIIDEMARIGLAP